MKCATMEVASVPQGTIGVGECHTNTLPSDGSLQRNPRRNRQPRRENVPHPNPPSTNEGENQKLRDGGSE